jgi:hypothetical protein
MRLHSCLYKIYVHGFPSNLALTLRRRKREPCHHSVIGSTQGYTPTLVIYVFLVSLQRMVYIGTTLSQLGQMPDTLYDLGSLSSKERVG